MLVRIIVAGLFMLSLVGCAGKVIPEPVSPRDDAGELLTFDQMMKKAFPELGRRSFQSNVYEVRGINFGVSRFVGYEILQQPRKMAVAHCMARGGRLRTESGPSHPVPVVYDMAGKGYPVYELDGYFGAFGCHVGDTKDAVTEVTFTRSAMGKNRLNLRVKHYVDANEIAMRDRVQQNRQEERIRRIQAEKDRRQDWYNRIQRGGDVSGLEVCQIDMYPWYVHRGVAVKREGAMIYVTWRDYALRGRPQLPSRTVSDDGFVAQSSLGYCPDLHGR